MTPDVFYYLIAALNMMSFAIYGYDKLAAVTQSWRIPERQLLMLALTGGLGAMSASSVFRHKTRKQPFRRRAVALSAVHIVAIAAVMAVISQ